MGIKIKKRKLTNKKFSLQNGGAGNKIKPEFTKASTSTSTSKEIGAAARFVKKAKSVTGDALNGTKKGLIYAKTALLKSPQLAMKYVAKPVGKGIATAAISAPLAVTSGAVTGTAKAASAILKTTLWRAPVAAVQSIRAKLAKRNLTKKLGGLNMAERSRKLTKYSQEQEKLNRSRESAGEALKTLYEGKISKAKSAADVEKLETEQTTATKKLANNHQSELTKLLRRVIKHSNNKLDPTLVNSTMRSYAAGKFGYNKSATSLTNLLNKSKIKLQETYQAKKQDFQVTVDNQRIALDLNKKKSDLETQKSNLEFVRQQSKANLEAKKKLFDEAESNRNSIKREASETAGDFRKRQLLLEQESQLKKAEYLAQSQLYKKESSTHLDQEKNLLKEEQNLLKLEPKSLEYYEGQYHQRKEAANKAREKLNIGRQFRKIGQAAVKGFSWGAKQAEKTGIVYKVGNKAAELSEKLSEKLKPAQIVNTPQTSNYSFREKYLPSTSAGLTPFTSSQKKVENIYDTLFGKEGVNKKTTKELDDEINAKQALVEKYKGDPAEYNKYLKLQSEIKSLSDNKTTRLNLMKQARITTADYTTTNSFNKYKGNFKNDTAVTSILLNNDKNSNEKTVLLNEIKNNYLQQIQTNPKNLDLLNKYRDIKGLIKYYQSQTLQNAIKNEINTASSSSKA